MLFPDFACEASSLLDVGICCLYPEQISVRGKFLGALGSWLHAGLVVVKALASSGDVPVEVNW
jgi:hypothetical protein